MRISDWSSDVCSSDLVAVNRGVRLELGRDDTQRLDILAYRFRKAGDAADDLGDAVGGHIVRDRRNDVVIRNPQTVEGDDAEVRGTVHDHKVVLIDARLHRPIDELDRNDRKSVWVGKRAAVRENSGG